MFKTPFPLFLADMYSQSSDGFACNDAKSMSYYSITNRYSPKKSFDSVADDSRMVFYGLSNFIDRYLRTQITLEEVNETDKFMQRANSLGGGLFFPKDKWLSIVNDMNGYLPIEIRGLPECSVMFPSVPFVSIKSTVDGFGEFAAAIEAGITGFVSIHTARTTFLRHWLNKIKEWVSKDMKVTDDEVLYKTAQFMLHDFSMRAHALPEEAESLGLCNLLCFHGSDTSSSCYQAWKMGCHDVSATSIHAAAHRNIQPSNTELEFFESLHECSKIGTVNIASYLLDCYNFNNCVVDSLAKIADKYPSDVFVGRGDSGNALKNVLHILQQQKKNVRFIEGNSIKPHSMFKIMQGIMDNGFSITQGIFGVGGACRNNISRDSLSTKYALAAVSDGNGGSRPVIKLSEDADKLTIPGPNKVDYVYDRLGQSLKNVIVSLGNPNLPIYYHHCESEIKPDVYEITKFSTLQDRCIKNFDEAEQLAKSNPDYGLNRETLHPEIIRLQDETFAKYRS